MASTGDKELEKLHQEVDDLHKSLSSGESVHSAVMTIVAVLCTKSHGSNYMYTHSAVMASDIDPDSSAVMASNK